MDALIKKSIEYAFSNYPAITQYVQQNSQEMDTEVMKKHIDLYVNEYSLSLGQAGKAAIKKLVKIFAQMHNDAEVGKFENDDEMFEKG